MITKIGIVAGDIWSYLEKQDRTAEMDDLVRELKKEKELVLMSVGWLAREGHIVLEGDGPNYTVKLSDIKGGEDD